MTARRAAKMGAVLVSACTLIGCWGDCEEPLPIESGTYVVTGKHYGQLQPGDEWVRDAIVGAQLVVDAEAGTAVIIYEVDGATVEVRFRLEEG